LKPFLRILVVDDERVIREGIRQVQTRDGYAVNTTESGKAALEELSRRAYDLVLLDIRLPDQDGLEVLRTIVQAEEYGQPPVIMVTGYPEIETAVESIKLGALDYLTKPLTPDQLKRCLHKALEYKRLILENQPLRSRMELPGSGGTLIGKSRAMQEVFSLVQKVAPTDSTVLISGPSGTGKELVARAIHQHSPRKHREFVAVDCSALVETLMESELFGHIKGSFTGAIHTKHGLFELADGGTFFFDEISNLSLNIQAKLLRVIQEREFHKVGSEKSFRTDVRIIASTNLDLREAIVRGGFREDLFYRLSVVPIPLPPLKQRREDIPLLVEHFLKKFEKKRPTPLLGITPEALEILLDYDWPGNVRELEHTIERLCIVEEKNQIALSSLPWHLREKRPPGGAFPATELIPLADLERAHILKVLDFTGGNRTRAATILGINRKTLAQKLK
jgi:DNA-binding NtrC family response regulator